MAIARLSENCRTVYPCAWMSDVTRLLDAAERGEAQAAEELLPLVYEELRRLAAAKMASQPPGQTLQATGLVHEVWLRLVGDQPASSWNSRGHFFAAAAEAMRRILVENVRRKQAQKRGAGAAKAELQEADLTITAPPDEILRVHEALDLLTQVDSQAAELVKLRYFVGLTIPEAAESLSLPVRSAERLWTFARSWLHRQLNQPA